MKDLTPTDKELLQTLLRKEFDSLKNEPDNVRYLHIIDLSEKLYLDNGFIAEMKKDLDV